MSPRAAWRLESLGFTQVYDYVAGKTDWAAAGLPIEGELAAVPRIGDVARTDVPTCRLGDRVGEVAETALGADWQTCMVVTDERIVLGRLYETQLRGDGDARVEDVMQSGPSTFRPNIPVPNMLGYMLDNDLSTAPVTTSEGRLVGVLRREDVEQALHEWHEAHDGEGSSAQE